MEKSKTRQEMAAEYGVDRKTFYGMLKKVGVCIPPGLVSPKYQELIYRHFGKPNSVIEREMPEYEKTAT